MAERSEKRFQKIMDRLYYFPKSSGGGAGILQKGKKRGGDLSFKKCLESAGRSSSVGVGVKDLPQPCRPWDRGDLVRRLSTFKAMTWFGKPKAISPVNCARRGWVNVDMDTIACEACASRLLFSTPSSWAFNQVEKAAAVFSLKLDNGHKLLCPWTDNICDESLALFPPTPAPTLVEGYKERASALLQLSALPVISSSAVDYMGSPQLEQLLKEFSTIGCTLNKCIKLNDTSSRLSTDFVSDAASAKLYFQAQKIISLCGWELHLLPYYVDCEIKSDQSVAKAESSAGCLIGEKNYAAVIRSSHISMDVEGEKDNQEFLGNQFDPASAVLDCKYCGARVGLWAFKSIPRPLELFSLSDFPDVVEQNDSIHVNGSLEPREIDALGTGNKNSSFVQNEHCSNLNLTIAGGLPPAKQNFRPIVSLPIISRHLRAELSAVCDVKNHLSSISLGKDNTVEQVHSGNGDTVVSTGSADTLKHKRNVNECYNLGYEETCVPYSELCHDHNGASIHEDAGKEKSVGNESHSLDTEDGRLHDSCPTSDPTARTSGAEIYKNDLLIETTDTHNENARSSSRGNKLCQTVISHNTHHDSSYIASCSEAMVSANGINNTDLEKDKSLGCQNFAQAIAGDNDDNGLQRAVIHPVSDQPAAPNLAGMNPVQMQWDNIREFDPIRQHRAFCPWIVWGNGDGMPGWKLSLFAVVQDRDSLPALLKEAPLRLANEVDDPIVSVRRLFTPPPSKRLKCSK